MTVPSPAQLLAYWNDAKALRGKTVDPYRREVAVSNLRGIVGWCKAPKLREAAAHHLDLCGYDAPCWSRQFTDPNGGNAA